MSSDQIVQAMSQKLAASIEGLCRAAQLEGLDLMVSPLKPQGPIIGDGVNPHTLTLAFDYLFVDPEDDYIINGWTRYRTSDKTEKARA
jgi:hypothetical protein